MDLEIENQNQVNEEKAKILSVSIKIGLLIDFTWSFLAAMAKRKNDKYITDTFGKESTHQFFKRGKPFLRDCNFSYFYCYSVADYLILIIHQFAYFFPLFFL